MGEYIDQNDASDFKNILGIINFNLEREEKERLFESKVSELKQIFDKQNLENLKNLSFEFLIFFAISKNLL